MLHALASSGFFAQESAQATPSAPQPPAEVLFATAFLFILFSNWFGTLPIGYLYIRNPEGVEVPIFRSADSDLNVTAAMAILMIVLAEFFEFRSLGLLGYLKGLLIPNPMR